MNWYSVLLLVLFICLVMLGPALIIRKLIYKKQIGKIYAAIVVGRLRPYNAVN